MQTPASTKFCSVCKRPSKVEALVCDYCGAVFIDLQLGNETTKGMTDRRSPNDLAGVTHQLKTPVEGMAFFLFGKTEAFTVLKDDVIYLGRVDKESNEVFVDLAKLDGFEMGVSRRHAMIQRHENRVEIMDLHSSNGTFLNGSRLLPDKLYELKSGIVIQLGRLKLIAIFSWDPNR